MVARSLAVALALTVAAPAFGASIERLATDGGPGNIAFQHLQMNEAGDFVGVTNRLVYVGNAPEKRLELALETENTSFVLTASKTLQINTSSGPHTVYVDIAVLETRLQLNAQGDFILASNAKLYLGNARTGQIHQVADGGAYTDFQAVKINDAGQYVAIGYDKIFGGRVTDPAATLLLQDAPGSFEVTELYGYSDRITGTIGEKRLALNAQGQFVALTRGIIYVGDLAGLTVTKLFEERGVGFQHVNLTDAGVISIVTDQEVFVGNAN